MPPAMMSATRHVVASTTATQADRPIVTPRANDADTTPIAKACPRVPRNQTLTAAIPTPA